MSAPPPYFVLTAVASPLAGSSTLVHPVIHFQYADDAPLSLEASTSHNVLIMDFDPARPQHSVVHSLSPSLAVAGLRVSDAAGAGPEAKMYVVETITSDAGDMSREQQTPAMLLQRFKQRNELLRRALNYPRDPPPRDEDGSADGVLLHSPPLPRSPISLKPPTSRRAS